jgi:hypothetical protein
VTPPPETTACAEGSVATVIRTRPRWWRELLIAVAVYAVYDAIRGVIAGTTGRAERDGRDLLHWEQFLHLDPERWLNTELQHLTWLAVPACYFYATLHFVVTPSVLVWIFHRHRDDYRRARTVLGLITVTALLGFWRFPTAPPRLLASAGFHDTLATFSTWGWWGSDASVPAGATAIANQYAAMPSLHMAWALWCGAIIARNTRRQWIKLLGLLYPLVTALVVLATANHYLLDVLAGVAIWLAATGITGWLNMIGIVDDEST